MHTKSISETVKSISPSFPPNFYKHVSYGMGGGVGVDRSAQKLCYMKVCFSDMMESYEKLN